MATQTFGNVARTFQDMDSFYSEDDDATPRMPSKPTFEPLRLPSFTRTLSASSSSSSSSSYDSSSDESALLTPTDSYGRSSKYTPTHSQLRAALASDPRRQIRPRISAHGLTSDSASSEDEFTACTPLFPQKQATSKPKPGARHRAVNKFAIIGRPSVILPSYPITSMPSISRCDSRSSSSSDPATPTEEKSQVFPTSLHHSHTRKQHTNAPALRPSHINIASPLVFGSATPPAFITPVSTPRAELGERTSGTAGMHVFQVLAKVNEKLDVEATLRMKLEQAAKGMNRDVWERRMARRGRKAL